MKPRNIKHWECKSCGYRSDRSKTLQIGGLGFAKCFRCGNPSLKETPEWLEWNKQEQERWAERGWL